MSSRFLIPVLCVGAVVFAGGPRTRSDAATPLRNAARSIAPTPASASRPVASRRTKDTKPNLAATLYVRATDSTVRLALRVVNTGDKRVEVRFPSGQRYDFVILDSVGREVWRWAAGRMFTQTLRNTLLGAGASLELEETWREARLAPGRYVARGLLTSSNFPLSQETEFRIEGSTLARRNQ